MRVVALVPLVLFAASACQVTLDATFDVKSDGTGFVRAGVGLDADAVRSVPDLAQQLRVDDLRQSGWTVTGPEKEGDGLTWVRASKPFSNAAQAAQVVAELGGASGPFRDFTFRQTRTVLRSETEFSGTVDLTGGMSSLIDEDLKNKVGGDFKLDDRLFKVDVSARLPGASRTWHPAIGQTTPLALSSSSWRLVPIVPGALAVVFGFALLVVVAVRRRRRRARPAGSSFVDQELPLR